MLSLTQGDDFHVAFSQIGNLRSIISQNVHVLALTATATSDFFTAVKKRLCLDCPTLVGVSPSRENIKYHVEPLQSINSLCEVMTDGLLSLHSEFPKTLIFCQTIPECVTMYKTFRRNWGCISLSHLIIQIIISFGWWTCMQEPYLRE